MKHATAKEFESAGILRRQGLTYQQIADKLRRSVAWAFQAARFAMPQKNASGILSPERNNTIEQKFRSGKTLAEIGTEYGITRERVRQILAARGVTQFEGGRTIRSFLNIEDKVNKKQRRVEKRNVTLLRRYGITLAEYEIIKTTYGGRKTKRSPFNRFARQRQSAKRRGISWNMTFKDWWNTWTQSGKWDKCGRGQGYCMARIGDSGGYEVGNVYITTAIENSHTGRQKKYDLPLGVRYQNKRYFAQRMINGNLIHIGSFPTPQQAHAAYLSVAEVPEPGVMAQ